MKAKHKPPFLHYGVRLTVEQLQYLKNVPNPAEFIREAITEKIRRENTIVITETYEETVYLARSE